MKLLVALTAVAFVGAGLVAAPPPPKPDKKTNKDLIVGNWKLVKSTNGIQDPDQASTQIEFTKDGKMFVRIVEGDKKRLMYEARYKLEGDKEDKMPYESITEGYDHKETSKILKLTETEFSIEDPDGIVEDFKRMEEKKDEKKEEKK